MTYCLHTPILHLSTFLGAYACHLLQSAGFVISPKSVLIPMPSITWLEKQLAQNGITNLPSRQAQVLLAIWAFCTVVCSHCSLQRVLGSLQWMACPHSLVCPWLAPVYQYLFSAQCGTAVLPLRPWCFLLTAFLLTLLPVTPRAVPPPATMPLLFTDAAPSGNSFIVACHRPSCSATVVQTPDWVATLQDVEFYGVFHAARQCALSGLSHFCLFTDNIGVYYTLITGRVAASSPVRARIYRRILRICLVHSLQMQVGWVPGSCNSADMFSRPLQFTAGICLLKSLHTHVPRSLPAMPTTVMPALWFRSFPSRC